MNPPVRGAPHRDAIWRSYDRRGRMVLGSDHARTPPHEKEKPLSGKPVRHDRVQTLVPSCSIMSMRGACRVARFVYLRVRPGAIVWIACKGRLHRV